jgi:hypothetical protein
MRKRQKINTTLAATAFLLMGFLILQLLEWFSLELAALFSGFQGHIQWNNFVLYAQDGQWNKGQFIFLFLTPGILFFILFLWFSISKRHMLDKPMRTVLWKSWFFLLLMIKALFLPMMEIIERKGIYFAVSSLGLSRSTQYEMAFFLLGLFIFNIPAISSMFSHGLFVKQKQFLAPKQILPQLVFLWLIPFMIFLSIVYLVSRGHLEVSIIYYLVGIAGTLLINTPVISHYQVIAK